MSSGLLHSYSVPITLPVPSNLSQPLAQSLTLSLMSSMPYQGAIVEKNSVQNSGINKSSDSYTINIGESHRKDLTPQGLAKVYRMIYQEKNPFLTQKKLIGTLKISEVAKQSSTAFILKLDGSSVPQVGDLVIIHPSDEQVFVKTDLVIYGEPRSKPLSMVNIYSRNKERRVGYSDKNGWVMIQQEYLNRPQKFTLLKPGYEPKNFKLTPKRSDSVASPHSPQHSPQTIVLTQTHSFIRVASSPPRLKAYLYGKYVGKTPLKIAIAPRTFLTLSLKGPQGYKSFSRTYPLSHPWLDLSGNKSIKLEKDYLKQYRDYLKKGDQSQALKILSSIPSHHSDYKISLDLRAKAAHLAQDSSRSVLYWYRLLLALDPQNTSLVAAFAGSLFQGGMSSFSLAEQYDDQQNFLMSSELYSRAMDFFFLLEKSSVLSHKKTLRDLSYYLTLAIHRKSLIQKNQELLEMASMRWDRYLSSQNSEKSTRAEHPSPLYQEAVIYAKQAQKTLKSRRF